MPRKPLTSRKHKRLTIELPPEFIELCTCDNVTPEMVLRGFIADVAEIMNWFDNPRADGYSSNGSGERQYARDYYDRAGFSWLYKLKR